MPRRGDVPGYDKLNAYRVWVSDQKMTLRGFQDGEYNVTFDGIPLRIHRG